MHQFSGLLRLETLLLVSSLIFACSSIVGFAGSVYTPILSFGLAVWPSASHPLVEASLVVASFSAPTSSASLPS